MIRLLWGLSVNVRYLLRRYMPSNIVIDAILTRRRGLKWGVPAMLLAVPYFLVAHLCVGLIEADGPGWLHLIVLISCWGVLKMLCLGPVSVVLLVHTRFREARVRRRAVYDREVWDEESVDVAAVR